MPPQCRTPPGQKPGYPPGPAPIAPLMAMVSMPLWLDDTSTAVRGYSSSWSPPDTSRAPFPHRSPRWSSANAACGGLKPPPDRRLRRAKPSSPAEHRFLKVLPIYVQTAIPRSWRTSGGPCTTALRWSPHESSQVAHTHQRDSAINREWLRDYSAKNPRHGFRRAWAALRHDEHRDVNKKKVHRVWKQEG